jgi:DNA ligase-associated metallophosphoesterase
MDDHCLLPWRDERLRLLADRALLVERTSTLVIADPHFGKTATFRAAGIPLPPGTTATNLERLTQLIDRWGPARLLVVGDFWHAPEGRDDEIHATIAAWRAAHSQLAITLVRGNHDRRAGDPPADWDVTCVNEPLIEGRLAWRHYPAATPDAYTFAGHLHPILRLRQQGDKLQAPCFHFGSEVAVLPAFSRFTGGTPITVQPGDRVFAVGPNVVTEVAMAARTA